MTKEEILDLENKLAERRGGLRLLAANDAATVVSAIRKAGMRCPSFEGFILHHPSGVQPEQDYSRDYSTYSSEEAFKMCLEYFRCDKKDNVKYDLAYDRTLAKETLK